MKVTIYANYGVLAAENRCIYTHLSTAANADVSEQMAVIIPEKFAPYESESGDVILTIDGYKYTLREVLCGNDHPCIMIPGPSTRYERLALG